MASELDKIWLLTVQGKLYAQSVSATSKPQGEAMYMASELDKIWLDLAPDRAEEAVRAKPQGSHQRTAEATY